jgi:hypothetical protein
VAPFPLRILSFQGSNANGSVNSTIERQEEHHRTRTLREEYLELLRRSGVEFDERYV